VRRDIRFEANMKRIFICFEGNKTGFIRFFCIEADQRILHAKRVKTEANIPCYANILLISLESENFEAK
jgi:hypothetical protein